MRRIDKPGSASASLPAMMQPAVPPIWEYQSEVMMLAPQRFVINVPPAMITSTPLISSGSLVYRPIFRLWKQRQVEV